MLTQQRSVIINVLKKANRPLTRKEILTKGRALLPKLGSATVDRAINKLTEDFQLIGLAFPGQSKRYELPAEQEHPHFICRVCEKVFDLDIPMRLPEVAFPEGFYVSGGEVVYSGTCPQCHGRMVKG